VVKINVFTYIAYLSYSLFILISIFLISYIKKIVNQRRLERFLTYNSPILSLLFLVNGSYNQALRTILKEKKLFGTISALLTQTLTNLILKSNENSERGPFYLINQKILEIIEEPNEIINRTEDIYSYFIAEVEAMNQNLIFLDEKISIILFVNYFVPFIILFIFLLGLIEFEFFIIIFNIFMIFSIFFTAKVMKIE